MPDDRIVTIFN